MSQQELDPIMKDQFLALPAVIRDIITDSGWQFKIRDLVKKFNIRIDQGGIVEHEILLVMLGFDEPENFVKNIVAQAGIDQKTAEALVLEVEKIIFGPIKQALIIETNKEKAASGQTVSSGNLQPLESREDLLKQIEDPSEIPMVTSITPSISPNKITSPVQNAAVVAPNISSAPATSATPTAPVAPLTTSFAPITSTPKIDPYREPIE